MRGGQILADGSRRRSDDGCSLLSSRRMRRGSDLCPADAGSTPLHTSRAPDRFSLDLVGGPRPADPPAPGPLSRPRRRCCASSRNVPSSRPPTPPFPDSKIGDESMTPSAAPPSQPGSDRHHGHHGRAASPPGLSPFLRVLARRRRPPARFGTDPEPGPASHPTPARRP